MKMSRNFNRAAVVFALFSLLSLIILAAHIAMVTNPTSGQDTRSRQLTRIDLNTEIESVEGDQIYTALANIEGVRTVKIIQEKGIILVEFDPTVLSSLDVKEIIARQSTMEPAVFTLPQQSLSSGCPVRFDNGFWKRVMNLFARNQ